MSSDPGPFGRQLCTHGDALISGGQGLQDAPAAGPPLQGGGLGSDACGRAVKGRSQSPLPLASSACWILCKGQSSWPGVSPGAPAMGVIVGFESG
jgi:hypothetical protein